jgi:hypothetical protein
MRNALEKVVDKIKTHFMFCDTVFKNLFFCEIMWKNILVPDRSEYSIEVHAFLTNARIQKHTHITFNTYFSISKNV